jgi:hypothetical protein
MSDSNTDQKTARSIVPPVLARPVGDGGGDGGGGNGGGPGCQPGRVLLSFTMSATPAPPASGSFVPLGTVIELSASAASRLWLPNCTYHDQGAPVEWQLFYQPVGGSPGEIGSRLADDPSSNTNSFVAGQAGTYSVLCSCPAVISAPGVPGALGQTFYAGTVWSVAGTLEAWVTSLKGTSDITGIPVTGVLIQTPDGSAQFTMNPVAVGASTVSQTSGGGGQFDDNAGALTVSLGLHEASDYSGDISITLSTDATITPPDGSAGIPGRRFDANGTGTLVGDAAIAGPPGTTDIWLMIDATLTRQP